MPTRSCVPSPIIFTFLYPPRLFSVPYREAARVLNLNSSKPIPPSSIRHASTSRRTTKLLRPKPSDGVPPKPRDLLKPSKPSSKRSLSKPDTITFNPPSSAPNAFHTPPLFLPSNDIRKTVLATAYETSNPYASDLARNLPPSVSPVREKAYHMTIEQIDEMRALRVSDPFKWTRKVLAEKYGCTEYFVGMCVQAPSARMKWSQDLLQSVKARWGARRLQAREERTKRRIMWGKDE